MKTLIFSDSHLTDRFEEDKYLYLTRIISSVDRVIINGDFWEGFWIPFDHFFNSKWQKLFPLLKEKQTTYIFGNHDFEEVNDRDKIKHFSDIQTASYTFSEQGKTFIIEHGHRIFPTERDEINTQSLSFRLKVKTIHVCGHIATALTGDHYQQFLLKNNTIMKQKLGKPKKNIYRIFGHTHCPEFDITNNFINTGLIKFGLAQYILIDDGKITLVKERYH